MKKVEIILGNEKHVLVPDENNCMCDDSCSLQVYCESLGASTLCGCLQDAGVFETCHFEKVPI